VAALLRELTNSSSARQFFVKTHSLRSACACDDVEQAINGDAG
jgi:hypothetical protein